MGSFFAAFSYASRGWGYIGYNGFHSGSRHWGYWGGPRTYFGPSARSGSLGGPGHRGGGLSGGK
ncbi:MAG: hypothetical protein OEZ13_13175 [Spirochaetia bacterium]|nr:hypothetical protein [Spirochaetia bacterium]